VPRTRPRLFSWGWLFGCVWSAILAVLIYVSALSLRDVELPTAPPPTPNSNWAADFPARIDQVTKALERLPWPLPTPHEEPNGAGALRWTHRRYDLSLAQPQEPAAINETMQPVRSAAPGVTVRVAAEADGAQVLIGVDGLLTHTLTLHWVTQRPQVAIIIDDLGNDLRMARALVDLDAPLTLAIMPFRPFSQQAAQLAGLFHREVLVHLPMEAESGEEFGATEVLHADADRSTILRGVDDSLAALPQAVGVNNHMGSRLTADRERMQWILERLKEKGLFFIDSRTTPRSVACDVATRIALPCAGRDVFLDDTDEEAAIREQLQSALQLARVRGRAIAIGHPRQATLAALQATLGDFAAAGVDLVPVSALVAERSLSRR